MERRKRKLPTRKLHICLTDSEFLEIVRYRSVDGKETPLEKRASCCAKCRRTLEWVEDQEDLRVSRLEPNDFHFWAFPRGYGRHLGCLESPVYWRIPGGKKGYYCIDLPEESGVVKDNRKFPGRSYWEWDQLVEEEDEVYGRLR